MVFKAQTRPALIFTSIIIIHLLFTTATLKMIILNTKVFRVISSIK